MDVNATFRLRLQAEMEAQGLNPSGLSRKANLNRRAATDLLEGRAQSPKLSTAHALAVALGVGLDGMVGLKPQQSLSPRLAELLTQFDQAQQERLAEAIFVLSGRPEPRR